MLLLLPTEYNIVHVISPPLLGLVFLTHLRLNVYIRVIIHLHEYNRLLGMITPLCSALCPILVCGHSHAVVEVVVTLFEIH